jgi:hypothetical protein
MTMGQFGQTDITADALLAIALGQFVVGIGNKPTSGRANGYVGTSATTSKAIRATAYAPQGANAQRSVVSTNANDSSAGTGARTVTINYLTAAFALKSETVTMNGTTPVNTVNVDIAYIESIVVATVGSGGGNVGTIQVFTFTAGGGSVWGSIAAGDNQTFWAHHYVPSGTMCLILSVATAALLVGGQSNLNITGDPSNPNLPQLQGGPTVIHAGTGFSEHEFALPLAVAGPNFVFMTTRPVSASVDTAFGHFDWVQF